METGVQWALFAGDALAVIITLGEPLLRNGLESKGSFSFEKLLEIGEIFPVCSISIHNSLIVAELKSY